MFCALPSVIPVPSSPADVAGANPLQKARKSLDDEVDFVAQEHQAMETHEYLSCGRGRNPQAQLLRWMPII